MTPNKAMSAVLGALALGVAPVHEVLPSAWAAQNLVVPDGPRAGTKWDPSLTPQLVEPLDQLAVSSPANQVGFRKSAQIGYSQIGQAFLGYVIDVAPAKTMMVLPTIETARDFNREKLSPSIEASPALRAKVRRQTARSAEGSTALNKRFRGGSIVITGANSAADLRSKTVAYAFGDEIEEWPIDLDGQGDPLAMLEARQMSFLATGNWKRLLGSTPAIKGGRTDVLFEGGDQRYWQVPCPHCGAFQRLNFFPDAAGAGGLRFEKTWPHSAYYACAENGCVIEHWQKDAMVKAGRWVASEPGPGKYPSYHLDTLTSLLVGWDDIAAKFLESKENPTKLKAFYNLWLGLGWEERGEAPDWKRLYERAEDYPSRSIPPGGLVLTGAADVQKMGIYFEVVAWGHNLVNWVVDAGYLEGETAEADGDVWKKLTEVQSRLYEDAEGNLQGIEAFACDAGYATNSVYDWTRKRPRRFAVKGQPGWYHPAVGTASKQDVTKKGKKVRTGGAWLWPVGTWSLKAELYASLRLEGRRDGAEAPAPGFCHFGKWLDERYFQQLTAEHLKDKKSKSSGRIVREWVASGENHYHDCRIYNMAMAAYLRLALLRPVQWDVLSAARRIAKADNTDLVGLMNKPVPAPTPATPQAAPETGQPRTAFAPSPASPTEPLSKKPSVSSRLA